MPTKPNTLPEWATNDLVDDLNGLPNQREPTPEFKASGLNREENLGRQHLNYQFDLLNQWITWIASGMGTTGQIITMPFTTAPEGHLLCDGALYSRDTYSDLFTLANADGLVGDGLLFDWGDQSTTFGVPDLRGQFIRMFDNTGLVDVDRAASGFGLVQADELESHTHTYSNLTTGGGSWDTTSGSPTQAEVFPPTSATGGTETRPTNVALNYFIKY